MTIRHHESDEVKIPVISVSEAASAGNWSIFGPSAQYLLPPSASSRVEELLRELSEDAIPLTKERGVYWL